MLNAELLRRQDQSLSVTAGPEVGQVISVRGSQVTVGLSTVPSRVQTSVRATVGKFLGIRTGESHLVGVITKVLVEALLGKAHGWHSTADVDLVGEIRCSGGSLQFQRGVSDYPAIGDSASAIGPRELRLVYNVASAAATEIGHLQQDSSITAYVDIDDMLCKHFAILGTTGVGKSTAVVLLLQEVIRTRPNLRILVLDTHNEYRKSHPGSGAGPAGQAQATVPRRRLRDVHLRLGGGEHPPRARPHIRGAAAQCGCRNVSREARHKERCRVF